MPVALHRLLWPVLIAVLAALLLVVAAWALQRRLIYFPIGTPPPADRALPGAREVRLVTEDGLGLGAWFLPGHGPPPWPAVLVTNGNAGHRGDRVPLAALLSELGLSVLLFDYRGYGGNPGRPDEAGLVRDARAARAWLEAQPEIDRDRVVLFGESLGAAVAVALAAERAPAALVLRSPFTSLVDVGRLHYPWLPVGWLLADRYRSLERIRSVTAPLLIVAGGRDRIVPEEMSRTLYEAAPAAARRYVVVPGSGHNSAALSAGPVLRDELRAFLERTISLHVPTQEAR